MDGTFQYEGPRMVHSTSDSTFPPDDNTTRSARVERDDRDGDGTDETRQVEPPSDSRAARFLRGPGDDSGDPADTAPMRRATYRPPEAIAELRDVVTAFRDALRDEADRRRPSDPEYTEIVRAAAQCEEAMGAPRRARELLERLAPGSETEADVEPAVERIRRRLLRRIDEDGSGLLASLTRSLEAEDGPTSVCLKLQAATTTWKHGAETAEILDRLDALGPEDLIGDWTLLWEAELRTDVLLEDGRIEDAKSHLTDALQRVETSDVAACLAGRAAVWEHVTGRPERAQMLLEPFFDSGRLPGDLARLYLDLSRETGRSIDLATLLDRYELPVFVVRALAVEQAHELRQNDQPSAGVDQLLACTARHGDDRTVLSVARNLLERLNGRDDDRAVTERLVETLNRLVEVVDDPSERAELLVRLGRLYERETGYEEAAADVYREALELKPGHSTAVRSLGRLYDSQHNWKGLAGLYRHEIEHATEDMNAWRTRLRLARLLEDRLGRPETAFEAYQKVLKARGWERTALKGAARQLRDLNRWDDLVELFLESADRAPSDREAAYLLRRAAEVAEERLGATDIAIGAWEEVTRLEPHHPAAYASLGRLLEREGRWEALVELNLRELEQVESDEKAADLLTRSAEIVAHHVGEPDRAVDLFGAALDRNPNHLPALEGMGRLLARENQWEAVVEMTEDQLDYLEPGAERRGRLAALAEVLEDRLDRPEEAEAIWADLLERNPEDTEARGQLLRMARGQGRWHEVCELLEGRARYRDGAERAAALGELASVLEWRLGTPDAACEEYLRALEADVSQVEWLEGVARCWPPSKNAPGEIANRLEDMVMHEMDGDIQDVVFKMIARLRERSETDAEASRGHRMHGARDSRENQTVLRFAMARSGERRELVQSRRTSAHHELEWLVSAPRRRLPKSERSRFDEIVGDLEATERAFLLGEMAPADTAEHVESSMAADCRLSAALVSLLDGGGSRPLADPEEATVAECRLRYEKARAEENLECLLKWARREVDRREGRDGAVGQLVDAARVARQRDAEQAAQSLHRRAAGIAFPDLDAVSEGEPGAFEGAVDEATLEMLYSSLAASEQWELMRACLEAHVSKDGLSSARRVELFERLADVLEGKLEELEAASRALSHCWQSSERPEYLRRRVVIDRRRGALEAAIRHQRRHFDVVSRKNSSQDEVAQSGIWLADLLLAEPETREEGIEFLEVLRDTCEESELGETVLRMLAYAYAEVDRPNEAVDAFQRVLKFEVVESELGDWRELIRLYEQTIGDPQTAYSLQWRIVHSFPSRDDAIERLVELAHLAGESEDCCEQLEKFAAEGDLGQQARRTVLARAAKLAEETLGRPEYAVDLLDEALETTESGSDLYASLLQRRTRCLAECTGREREAEASFQDLLDVQPFEASTYRPALKVFERERAHDRARLTRQVLSTIDDGESAETPRTKMRPSRTIDEDLVEDYLLPDELSAPVFHLLRQVMPLVEKVFSDELPQGKVLESTGSRAVDGREVSSVVADAMGAFEVGRHSVDAADNAPPRPLILGSSSPQVWLLDDHVEDMNASELRFTAGWSAAVAWSELAPLLTLDGRDVWHLLEATWLRQHGCGFEDCVDLESQRLSDEISSPFLTMARRRVVRAAEPIVDELPDAPCELWPDALEEFAGRAGLVLSGNLAAAIRSVLRFRGWELGFDAPETRDRLARTELVEKLLNFAYSDDYLQARYELGLSGRPSEVGIG